ncbi:MAG: matrixin family metalloprotease [Actinomycetota bacterium]
MKGICRFFVSTTIIATLVFSIGLAATVNAATDKDGGKDKVVFIHYKDGTVKPAGGGGGKAQTYTFLAKGVKWKALPVTYVINPTNEDGLSSDFVATAISGGAEEWDAYTSDELFGSYSMDVNASYDGGASADGRNEIVFGSYLDSRVIAITTIWGYFGGPVQYRSIVETDILFNNYFSWGDAAVAATKMDLQNIATHEIGHVAGLGDLYTTSALEETMYGYSTQGETKKRTLNAGDILGVRALYGN